MSNVFFDASFWERIESTTLLYYNSCGVPRVSRTISFTNFLCVYRRMDLRAYFVITLCAQIRFVTMGIDFQIAREPSVATGNVRL